MSVAQLIADFDQWKAMPGRDGETAVFGRNGLNAGSTILSHVHMVPLGTAEAARWKENFRKKRGNKSDRYLFYVDGGPAYGFLLLAIVNDPGGHAIWHKSNADLRKKWHDMAEQFYNQGIVP